MTIATIEPAELLLGQARHPEGDVRHPGATDPIRIHSGGTHATLTLREHETKVVSLTEAQAGELNSAGGEKYLSVGPAETPGHWQVSAHHYVGSITVDGLQVLVRPKIPLRNLFLLLEVGLREQDWRDEAALYETSHDLLPALVSFFARTAETTLARGLYHSYRENHDRLVALRGRVDVARQFARPGVSIPTACRFSEFTADLVENSYLKAAVSRSLRVAGVPPADRHRLMRHLVTLESVGNVRHRPADFDDVTFTRLNEHYRPALCLARLLLENLTLQDAIGEVAAASFMLDMNELFERFVTERLRRALRGRLDVMKQHSDHLDEERSVRIRPDLLFGPERSPSFVADIKYKLTDESAGGPNADLYQLLAYTTALDLSEGMLVYCLDADDLQSSAVVDSPLGENVTDISAPFPAAASTFSSVTAQHTPRRREASDRVGRASAFSSVVVRHTGTLLHTYALDLSGTPAEVGKSLNDLADWIVARVSPAALPL